MCDRFKFRVWHKEVSELIYEDRLGDCFRWYNDGQPVKLEQCTGLKDKHGVLIYEGDILQCNNKHWVKNVHWNGKWYQFGTSYMLCEEEIGWFKAEVVGNIHENPELLEAHNV